MTREKQLVDEDEYIKASVNFDRLENGCKTIFEGCVLELLKKIDLPSREVDGLWKGTLIQAGLLNENGEVPIEVKAYCEATYFESGRNVVSRIMYPKLNEQKYAMVDTSLLKPEPPEMATLEEDSLVLKSWAQRNRSENELGANRVLNLARTIEERYCNKENGKWTDKLDIPTKGELVTKAFKTLEDIMFKGCDMSRDQTIVDASFPTLKLRGDINFR